MLDTPKTSELLMKLLGGEACHCDFKPVLFQEVLREFQSVRIVIHHTRRSQGYVKYELVNRATALRHRLENLAPCKACIRKYNPTGRKRSQIWNPSRNRAFKEATQ